MYVDKKLGSNFKIQIICMVLFLLHSYNFKFNLY